MLKSLKLGIEVRNSLENKDFNNAVKLANKRTKLLVSEGKLSKWEYQSECQVQYLSQIKQLTDIQRINDFFKMNRKNEIIFALSSNYCLGLDSSDIFFATFCDLNVTDMLKFEPFQKSKIYSNSLWPDVLSKKFQVGKQFINNDLSYEARNILSLGKMFTRKLIFDFDFVQNKTFFNNEKIKKGLEELLDLKIINIDKNKANFKIDLKAKKLSSFSRAWSQLIGHYLCFKLSNLAREFQYEEAKINKLIDNKSYFKSICTFNSCQECSEISKTKLDIKRNLPPFHLGCRCTFELITPERGTKITNDF